jgi:hypothetical protein
VIGEVVATIAGALGICRAIWRLVRAVDQHKAAVDRLTDAVDELQDQAREHGWPLTAAGVR